jgi:hypothetical protein
MPSQYSESQLLHTNQAISLPCKKNLGWGLSNPTIAVKGKHVHPVLHLYKKMQ